MASTKSNAHGIPRDVMREKDFSGSFLLFKKLRLFNYTKFLNSKSSGLG